MGSNPTLSAIPPGSFEPGGFLLFGEAGVINRGKWFRGHPFRLLRVDCKQDSFATGSDERNFVIVCIHFFSSLGKTTTMAQTWISYVAWDGRHWRTALNSPAKVVVNGLLVSVQDPDFTHVSEDGVDSHDDEFIGYITGDGSKWRSRCRTSSSVTGDVTFSFEHFPEGEDDSDHTDGTIEFLGTDGSFYILSMPPRNLLGAHDMKFDVRPK